MSMNGYLRPVTADAYSRICEDGDLADAATFHLALPEGITPMMLESLPAPIRAQLSEMMKAAEAENDEFEPDQLGDIVELDKWWHVLHYLITESAEEGDPPLAFAIMGGEPVGDDLGYGPAQILAPHEVMAVSAALDELTDEQIVARWVPPAGVYLAEGLGEDEFEHAADLLETVRETYRNAAQRGDAMLKWLS